ncbi:MAG: HAD-IIIA family hydrolase [Lachnospiraceae bacterium]|nr:HAD-IIIA family hydrolase [Lachnospiraceae bacterium]
MKDLKKIRLFAMDVDGTLTDGNIYIGNDGEAMKAFSPKDGLGLKLLMKHGIIPAIITGRTSRIVENRCQEIGITELYQGIHDKDKTLQELMKKYGLSPEETAYIGDDMNDVSAMLAAGVTFAPADCARQLLPYIDIHLTKKAGDSPVREAIDMILEGRLTMEDYQTL